MKRIVLALVLLVIGLYVLMYGITSNMFFHPDLARDYHEVLKISQGDLVFTGPKLTFGGLYTGPYYFYLFVPVYFLTGKAIWSIYIFNALIYLVAILYLFFLSSKKLETLRAFLISLIILTNPILIMAARNPSNAFSYAPLFIILISFLYFNKKVNLLKTFVLGFLLGVIFNFHYVNIIFLPYFLWELYFQCKHRLKSLMIFALGGVASFLPLIMFEIKNHFVMITNTFIQKSYLNWTDNKNIPGNLSAQKNIFRNLEFMSGRVKEYLLFNPLLAWLLVTIAVFYKKLNLKPKEYRLLISSVISLVLFSVIVRFQFIQHYTFGVSLFILLSLVLVVGSKLNKGLLTVLGIVVIFFQVKGFDVSKYQPNWRNPKNFQSAVEFVLEKKLISKNEPFNLIQITKEQLLATLGYEYRYFFRLNNLVPNDEFNYPTAQKLVIFSELPLKDLKGYKSWEAEQFGLEYLKKARRYTHCDLTIFIVEK